MSFAEYVLNKKQQGLTNVLLQFVKTVPKQPK